MQRDPPAADGLSAPPGAVGMTHISSSLSGFYSIFISFLFSVPHYKLAGSSTEGPLMGTGVKEL